MPHIHTVPGQVDHTVEVYIVYKDKVLLRKHDKYKIWLSIGGHIELDEDPNQAAIREVKEEVGLDVELFGGDDIIDFHEKDYRELIPPIYVNRGRIDPTHEHVTYSYFASTSNNKVIPENIDDEWHWFTMAELEENKVGIKASIRHGAINSLKALGVGVIEFR
jgi:ADP-ribose pyrophosphatase